MQSNTTTAQPGGHSEDRIWTKGFISIFIVNFVMSMGQFMMSTLIPKYVNQLGGAPTVVGMVTGIFAVTALGIRPVAGPAMDYFRKNRLLTLAIGVTTISLIFYGLAGSIPMLIVARLIHGISMGVAAPLSLALVSNALPDSKMASGLGIFSMGGAVSTAIGPTIGLKLADTIGYSYTFFICAGLMALCFALSFQLQSERPERLERFKVSLKGIIAPEVLMPTFVIFLQMLAFSSINSFIVIYGGLSGVMDIGLYFTASAICMIVIRPFSGRFADRFGIDKSIVPGLVIFIIALILTSFSRTLPMFILTGVVTALGFGISEPLLQAMNMQLVPKERRGAAGNTNFMGIDIGMLVGPVLAGFVISFVQDQTGSEILGYAYMYRIFSLPVIAAIVLFLLTRKKLLNRMEEQRVKNSR